MASSTALLCSTCQQSHLDELIWQKTWDGQDYLAAFQYRHLGPVMDIARKASECSLCDFLSRVITWAGLRVQHLSLERHENGSLLSCTIENSSATELLGYGKSLSDRVYGGNEMKRISSLELRTHGTSAEVDMEAPQLYIPRAIYGSSTPAPSITDYVKSSELNPPQIQWLSGRLIDNDEFNIELFQKWMQLCNTTHGEACSQPNWTRNLLRPTNLRVIDVKRRCIVDLPESQSFVALSYVWGNVETLQLRRENIELLREDGALTRQHALSYTIDDAIIFTYLIGEKYMWADALCIVQDQPEDKQKYIQQMDRIYGMAKLTIVANSGTNANARLTGIAGSRTVASESLFLHGFSILSKPHNTQNKCMSSSWNGRGWTFQEKILSRKKVYFGIDEVSWECQLDTWTESAVLERTNPFDQKRPRSGPLASFYSDAYQIKDLLRSGDTLMAYSELVQDYTARNLSAVSDRHNAFLGLQQAISANTGEEYLFALPVGLFDFALSWRSNGGQYTVEKMKNKSDFPSWSWLTWSGVIHWANDLSFKYSENPVKTELTWYSVTSNGKLIQLTSPDHQGEIVAESNDSPISPLWGAVRKEPPEGYAVMKESGPLAHYTHTGRICGWTGQAKAFLRRPSGEEEFYVVICNDAGLPIGQLESSYLERFDESAISEAKFIFMSRQNAHVVDRLETGFNESRSKLNVLMVQEHVDGTLSRTASGVVDEALWNQLSIDWRFVALV